MKSIIRSAEAENDTELTVQISEGGRVNISFDALNTSVQQSMTVKDLKKFKTIIDESLEERTNQLKDEQEAE